MQAAAVHALSKKQKKLCESKAGKKKQTVSKDRNDRGGAKFLDFETAKQTLADNKRQEAEDAAKQLEKEAEKANHIADAKTVCMAFMHRLRENFDKEIETLSKNQLASVLVIMGLPKSGKRKLVLQNRIRDGWEGYLKVDAQAQARHIPAPSTAVAEAVAVAVTMAVPSAGLAQETALPFAPVAADTDIATAEEPFSLAFEDADGDWLSGLPSLFP